MSKAQKWPVRYFALHEAGLRNGSFFRINTQVGTVAQYVNGDFMGSTADGYLNAGPIVDGLPTTYAGQTLVEFGYEHAVKLIPKVCGGK